MTLTLDAIISTLTLVSTLSLKLIGFPSQILKVRKAGHLEGVSVLYFGLGFITYFFWTIHGILQKDVTVIVGQGIGVIASGVLLLVLHQTAKNASKKPGA
ncbi:MAG: hypothetical protein KGO92_07895 [Bacteroidota bacterium]|nr:hypothetical protein [Bacteroidota bacterium]